jgi:hypothetical protein
MKLTKGKLSKIRNKKHQTVKRFKKSSKGHKTKTFRKRKGLNLHNTSLKKYNGGKLEDDVKEDEEETPKTVVSKPEETAEEQQVPTSDVVAPISEEPVSEEQEPVSEEQEPVSEEKEPVSEQQVQGEEPVSEEKEPAQVEEPASISEAEEQDPVSEEPASISEEREPIAEDEPTPDVITEKPIENEEASEVESIAESDADQVPVVDQEPVVEHVVKNDLSIVAESLDKLAEYISDKIAQKLKYGSSSELNRDSFNAVATANNTMAEA